MKKIAVTDLGLEPKLASKLIRCGRIKTDDHGYVTPESYEKYQDFMSGRYFLAERAEHLAKSTGITLNNFYNKLCKGSIDVLLENIGERGSENSIVTYKKSDEPLIIEKIRAVYRRSSETPSVETRTQPVEGINHWLVARLVSGGTLKVDADGKVDSDTLKEFRNFMKIYYLLPERFIPLMKEAGIDRTLLYNKIYCRHLAQEFLTNVGGKARGTTLYAYRKEDEPKIIELLKKKPKGRQRGPNSQRYKKIARETTIDSSLIRISDAALDCSLEERLFEEVLQRLRIGRVKVVNQGVQIDTIPVEDYQNVRKYLWGVKQLR